MGGLLVIFQTLICESAVQCDKLAALQETLLVQMVEAAIVLIVLAIVIAYYMGENMRKNGHK